MWAIQKEIKDAYPKKVCHMPTWHDNEKIEREKRKDAYIKKVCHMPTRHVKEKKRKKKKKKIQPTSKENKEERDGS